MIVYRMKRVSILQAARESKYFLRAAIPMFPGVLRVALSNNDNIIFGTANLRCHGERMMRLEDYVPIFDPFIRYYPHQHEPFMYNLSVLDKEVEATVILREADWRRRQDDKERDRDPGVEPA